MTRGELAEVRRRGKQMAVAGVVTAASLAGADTAEAVDGFLVGLGIRQETRLRRIEEEHERARVERAAIARRIAALGKAAVEG